MMRLACLFVACAISVAPIAGRAASAADSPAKTKSTPKKASKKKPAAAQKAVLPTKAANRTLRPGALTVAVGHEINEDAHVTPFPSFAGHAQKALAQNRRDQLVDAEQAARATKQPDRWMTVLFHLRELDSRNDPEACFWRVVSYYRLGELARARALRASCEPPPGVQAVLDNEDAISTTLQPVAALPEMLAAGERPPAPVANPDAYGGPAYTVMTAQAAK
jgi:hypothetical protein